MVQGRKITNYGPDENLDRNTSFERSISKLSENHKIFDIGATALKLWPFNYPPSVINKNYWFNQWTLSAAIT